MSKQQDVHSGDGARSLTPEQRRMKARIAEIDAEVQHLLSNTGMCPLNNTMSMKECAQCQDKKNARHGVAGSDRKIADLQQERRVIEKYLAEDMAPAA